MSRQLPRDHDMQIWDNQDGTWLVNFYNQDARKRYEESHPTVNGETSTHVSRRFNDAQIFRIIFWAIQNELLIDGPGSLTLDYLNK